MDSRVVLPLTRVGACAGRSMWLGGCLYQARIGISVHKILDPSYKVSFSS
jgi:hypothetical protein